MRTQTLFSTLLSPFFQLNRHTRLRTQSTRDRKSVLSQTASTIYNRMAYLRLQSESIGQIILLIQAIAKQTKLLAMNAAIEAARAGLEMISIGLNEVDQSLETFVAISQETKSSTEEMWQASCEQLFSIERSVNSLMICRYCQSVFMRLAKSFG